MTETLPGIPTVTWNGQEITLRTTTAHVAALTGCLDFLARLCAADTRSLPNRDHPVLARILVDAAFDDPVRRLEFRMGYDQATLSLIHRRVRSVSQRLTLGLPWSGKVLDDLLGALSLARIYCAWRAGGDLDSPRLEDDMRQAATLNDQRGQFARMWVWTGLVMHQITEAVHGEP